jgi:hypothetical protein
LLFKECSRASDETVGVVNNLVVAFKVGKRRFDSIRASAERAGLFIVGRMNDHAQP